MTYYKERGISFPDGLVPRSNLELMKTFDIREEDIIFLTYPKAGTFWIHQVIKQILASEGVQDEKYLTDVPNLLEFTVPGIGALVELLKTAPSPRVMGTHVPVEFLPPGLLGSKAKIVVMMRNPKDTAVSTFHFYQKMSYMKTPESWDSFVEEFLAGDCAWGPFYDHVLGFWKLKDHHNILFLKYEDMKKDLPAEVRKLSSFLGRPLTEEAVQAVVSATQFDSMKKTLGQQSAPWARKGVIGDWKNHFSDEQSRAFDDQYRDRLSNTGLEFEFE
ncbi:PREDICTED: sulfotransferase 1C4-like [Branchiostoma belcheri]|uniref:Sulfotransferase n=1 Tax=Branchiostoma belcheri TaxID=7741 RepID=A0A6P5A219_BRABE|nr:PREDICTED: sulfotransferase 1C4-like [Branchiostoma belcheri]